MNRATAALAATTALAGLTLGTLASGYAAAPAPSGPANSSATALTLALAGTGTDSGTVAATHDGTQQVLTGQKNPEISVLKNQRLANIGVLAQEAHAGLSGQQGASSACSGVAGDGGRLVAIGDSGCLEPGAEPVEIRVSNLDLSGVQLIDPKSALAPLSALQPVIDQVVGPLTQALSAGLAPLDSGVITLKLGAVQSWCTADPGVAPKGSASLAGATIDLSVAGRSVPLVKLPVNPAPNTDVLVNLDAVLTAVLDGVRTELNTALDGNLAALSAIIDPIQQQIVDQLVARIAPQLAPLSDNVLKLVLNKQETSPDKVAVTALSLGVLPAATAFVGSPLVAAEVAQVSCGPNGRVATASPSPSPSATPSSSAPAKPGEKPKPTPDKGKSPAPKVPETVTAGLSGAEGTNSLRSALVAGGLLALALLGALVLTLTSRRSERS